MTESVYRTKRISIELEEAIENDIEGFLDLLSERAFGSPLLMDTAYKIVRLDGESLILEVTGDVSMIDEARLAQSFEESDAQ